MPKLSTERSLLVGAITSVILSFAVLLEYFGAIDIIRGFGRENNVSQMEWLNANPQGLTILYK